MNHKSPRPTFQIIHLQSSTDRCPQTSTLSYQRSGVKISQPLGLG